MYIQTILEDLSILNQLYVMLKSEKIHIELPGSALEESLPLKI